MLGRGETGFVVGADVLNVLLSLAKSEFTAPRSRDVNQKR